jgi:nitroreductase/NAD-dependent dihydropyrimidine dehydrogenase PreA subunit
MEKKINTIIDSAKCIGCGKCVKVCPSQTISMVDGKATVTGKTSINCGHCEQVCPVDAIKVTSLTELSFETFDADTNWLPPGESNTAQLVRLMASRRSCRNYTDQSVDRSMLEDLVKVGTSAPSATNSQGWNFTILPERKDIVVCGNYIVEFFCKINKLANNFLIRNTMSFFGKKELKIFHRNYSSFVEKAISNWHSGEHDYLFHGAPAVIIIGCSDACSMPMADAQLASQNIQLAAHSMGLGTCLIGFAVKAMANDRKICAKLGAEPSEKYYSVIAVGWPDEKYKHVCNRKVVTPRYPVLT